ncbi:MAG: hypothetical protein HY365_02700 [Candidatus Aenigmarchaeota archaeon]|nr:hypothetical protein [Candidatus Aenigmarchaeota archaeon]
MLESWLVFAVSVALNFLVRAVTPYFGAFRRGFDTVVFCSVTTGFIGGIKDGLLFGVLIAVTYYAWRSSQWSHALYVVPLAALTGVFAGMLQAQPYFQVATALFAFYHAISALVVTTVYRSMSFRYLVFIAANFATTFLLASAVTPLV